MAKYVILHFEDDDAADQYVRMLQQGSVFIWERTVVEGRTVEAEVRAVYKAPTKFCPHASSGPYTRGRKYGWWVHAKPDCMKPTPGWVRGMLELREYNQLHIPGDEEAIKEGK